MIRQVALLRGVNVGAARPVPMERLRELVSALGVRDVATHLRSGNVVFAAPDPPERMAPRIGRALADALGIEVAVVGRDAAAMQGVVAANPLPEAARADPRRLQVVFLGGAVPAGALDGLEDEPMGDDRVRVVAREIYVWSPGGVTGSPGLAALGRRRLPVVATARNWRTVERLAAMAAG